MKYQLETIPVWDAYAEKTECPLCLLRDRAERHYVEFFLGNSVMVPETRVEVNKRGFCPTHFRLLFQGGNKLGLALMVHTHMAELLGKLEKQQQALLKQSGRLASAGRLERAFRGSPELAAKLGALSNLITEQQQECMICTRIESTLRRYAFTILHLWRKDPEFRETLEASKGFCLTHLVLMSRMAEEVLSRSRLAEWLRTVLPLQQENLHRLHEQVHRFTQKFDYRSDDLPWEGSRDALSRALQKLTGSRFEEQ